jgi:predicted glycosyltransferase
MTPPRLHDARILMYSHDTFGLGHLRRCRTIAHALVESYHGISVLIISGAPIAGAFDYRARVDFVKIPSVIKLRNGEYTALSRHIDLRKTLELRRSIIRHTAETFRPDIFIADKEPMGLRGEIEETLSYLKTLGTTLVLGLRDVMDAPRLLEREWTSHDTLPKVERYYDRIWVYGPEGFNDPLAGLDVTDTVRDRVRYVGFLRRTAHLADSEPHKAQGDYILVTTGGGGDGAEIIRDVLAAYRAGPELTHRAIVVLGPYLPAKERRELVRAAAAIPAIEVIEFDNRMEALIQGAQAVVAMGGYNTFCEILSFDKPALLIPRTHPREEQLIRASRAAALGLAELMLPDDAADPKRLAERLKALPFRDPPSRSGAGVDFRGLESIAGEVGEWLLALDRPPNLRAVTGQD